MNDQPNNQNNNQNNGNNQNNQNNNQNRGGQPQNGNNNANNQKKVVADAPQEGNRKILRIAGVILVLVVIAALIGNGKWGHKAAPTETPVAGELPAGCTPGALFNTIDGKPCPVESTSTEVKDDTTAAAPGGYEEAIRMYAGKVVVFDASCKPLPVSPTFAPGTRILVANNSASTLTLAVGDKSESLEAYHYFTTPLAATAGNTVISCNGKPAATVVIK